MLKEKTQVACLILGTILKQILHNLLKFNNLKSYNYNHIETLLQKV